MLTKTRIRKEIKRKLNNQSSRERLYKSYLIQRKLFNQAVFKRAKFVMFYIATKKEVETRLMIAEAQKMGKEILVPLILRREKKIIACLLKNFAKELSRGPYEILQPKKKYIRAVPCEKIDLVIVPGLAFDRRGQRLGRGKGYYDKFLASLPLGITSIGLAFDFQILKNLPLLSHDIAVTKVIAA